jgi:beta-mannosidase
MTSQINSQTKLPLSIWRGGWGLRLIMAGVLSCLFTQTLSAQSTSQTLHQNWQFRQVGTEQWHSATLPGTVHTDLFANGIIEDPFKDNNEIEQQWIEKVNWEYKTIFDVSEDQFPHKHHELFFEGLDTYAEVFLNGKKILDANNMFRSWRVEVSEILKLKENELRIVFTSPILKHDSLARNHLKLPAGGDTSAFPVGPFTRKAAYHFGWDFAPRFVTSGIWKAVNLESWSEFILRDVYHKTISISDSQAIIETQIKTEADFDYQLTFLVNGQVFNRTFKKGNGQHDVQFVIKNPKHWWPNGDGEAHLYTIETKMIYPGSFDNYFQTDVQKIGLRTVELVNEKDSIGTSFYFKINGKPIFMKGANYVPQDVFLPRVQDAQYVHLLTLARDAGMNMLRVWGGGVYEKEIFYDLCDEYGILVWQDFMFANTMYSGTEEFSLNVVAEAEEQVKRLSKHPCIALWCGNNEIEVAWKNWGWQKQYDYSPEDSSVLWLNYNFLFEDILETQVQFYGQGVSYVQTSPQSNWGTPENFNYGSMHYWGVWHGNDQIDGFVKNVGRFMVEWGFQSYPDYDLLAEFISPKQLKIDSKVMRNRQKSYVGNKKIIDFIALQHYGYVPEDFGEFIQESQSLQAYAYQLAIRAHMSKQPHCMGTLLWQLNDCWPGPSWSIINYNGTPKEAYKAVKKEFTRE